MKKTTVSLNLATVKQLKSLKKKLNKNSIDAVVKYLLSINTLMNESKKWK